MVLRALRETIRSKQDSTVGRYPMPGVALESCCLTRATCPVAGRTRSGYALRGCRSGHTRPVPVNGQDKVIRCEVAVPDLQGRKSDRSKTRRAVCAYEGSSGRLPGWQLGFFGSQVGQLLAQCVERFSLFGFSAIANIDAGDAALDHMVQALIDYIAAGA